MARRRNASMKMKAPGAKKSVDNMKYEIASEFGVNLGPNASIRDNGMVGGEITKRLVENSMNRSKSNHSNSSVKRRKTNKKSKSSK